MSMTEDDIKIIRAAIARSREYAAMETEFGECHTSLAKRHAAYADRLEARLASAEKEKEQHET